MLVSRNREVRMRNATTLTLRNISPPTLNVFRQKFVISDWAIVFYSADVDSACNTVLEKFKRASFEVFSSKTGKVARKGQKPWTTTALSKKTRKNISFTKCFLRLLNQRH